MYTERVTTRREEESKDVHLNDEGIVHRNGIETGE
jgi:hypothetical protein